jgi:hypothetical protein
LLPHEVFQITDHAGKCWAVMVLFGLNHPANYVRIIEKIHEMEIGRSHHTGFGDISVPLGNRISLESRK